MTRNASLNEGRNRDNLDALDRFIRERGWPARARGDVVITRSARATIGAAETRAMSGERTV